MKMDIAMSVIKRCRLESVNLVAHPSFIGVLMNNKLFGIAAIIASVGFLISSIGDTFAYPQGPNVSLGSNPIVTISCSGHSNFPNVYQVPSGMDFIITDFHIGESSSSNGWIRVSSNSSMNNSDAVLRHYLQNATSTALSLHSGIKVTENLYLDCVGGSGGSFMSGYLTQM